MCAAVVAALMAMVESEAGASIRHGLRVSPRLVELPLTDERFQNSVDVITEQAARAVPVPSSGANYTYRYNSSTGEYERTSETFGPFLILERPETLGKNTWNIGVTGQYLELDEFDGNTVGRDPHPIVVNGDTVLFSTTPKIIYHVATVNVTYGLTDDLDLNMAIPIMTVDFDANARRAAPGGITFINTEHGRVSVAIGDIHLRAKYHVFSWEGLEGAAGLDVRLPTGQTTNALGTGTGTLRPYIAMSHNHFDWIEPHWNAGFEFDVVETNRSRAHYGMGVTMKPCEWFDVSGSLLGQSEFDGIRSNASVSGPHIVNGATVQSPYEGISVDRKDYFDAIIGARFRIWETLVLSAGVMKAINDDGLRSSNWSPIGAIQGTF
jgi:hypothetical protein